jgi:hypothetical protein
MRKYAENRQRLALMRLASCTGRFENGKESDTEDD